jgi:pimeloyl-ACP methyl ester carboxylesterase
VARRHRVFAPDLPGFGRSEKPRARYGIAYFTRSVERYMVEQRLDRAIVVGASLGGRVALELAMRRPDQVQRLVLVNALGLGRPRVQLIYPMVTLPRVGEAMMLIAGMAMHRAPPQVLRRVAGRYAGSRAKVEKLMDDAYFADVRDMYSQRGYSAAYLSTVRSLVSPKSILNEHDLSKELGRVRAPVLLVWGSDDPLFPLEHATRAHRLMPTSQLAVIEGAGHSPQAERPEEFNRILKRFIDS